MVGQEEKNEEKDTKETEVAAAGGDAAAGEGEGGADKQAQMETKAGGFGFFARNRNDPRKKKRGLSSYSCSVNIFVPGLPANVLPGEDTLRRKVIPVFIGFTGPPTVVRRLREATKTLAEAAQSRFKTTRCTNGSRCKYGVSCIYAHSEKELRTCPQVPRTRAFVPGLFQRKIVAACLED